MDEDELEAALQQQYYENENLQDLNGRLVDALIMAKTELYNKLSGASMNQCKFEATCDLLSDGLITEDEFKELTRHSGRDVRCILNPDYNSTG